MNLPDELKQIIEIGGGEMISQTDVNFTLDILKGMNLFANRFYERNLLFLYYDLDGEESFDPVKGGRILIKVEG